MHVEVFKMAQGLSSHTLQRIETGGDMKSIARMEGGFWISWVAGVVHLNRIGILDF